MDSANKSIQCTIKECKNHCGTENYCTLSQVNIGTHDECVNSCECTDCKSFILK